jgi:hypothetical protein
MIARLDVGGGDSRRTWKKYLLLMAMVLVAGLILSCVPLRDPRFASPPPPTREPIPATMQVTYAAEGYSLATEKARAWKQQACLADVLASYDWTGTKWKATQFTYYFLDQPSEQLLKIRIKPEARIMELYQPFSLSANRSIPDHCLMTPPDQWQEKEALDSVTQMLRAELAAPCEEVRASMESFEPFPSFSWSIRIGVGFAMRPLLGRFLFDVSRGEIHVIERGDPDTPCE